MFTEAHKLVNGEVGLPPGGIMSSIGIPNPGLGLWCFGAIALFTQTPVQMVQGVMLINVIVLWGFAAFVVRKIPKKQRETWLWGLAIAAINPLALVFSRKIWIPDLVAPFIFLCFVGHWFRDRFWGAFCWGFFSLCSGQIHMGGLFFTLGFWLWTIWHDWRKKQLGKSAWFGWFLGSAIAAIPLIYWLWDAIPQWQRTSSSIVGLLVPKFYAQWITSALGVNLSYPLQKVFWSDFLAEPLLLGKPTYLMLIVHVFLVFIGLWAIGQWGRDRLHKETYLNNNIKAPRPKDEGLGVRAIDAYLNAMGIGVGGTFTATATNVVPYYIPIVFPFPFLWLARTYQSRQMWLLAILVMQLCVSLTFLHFIHIHGGCDNTLCDYGRTYFAQLADS